VQVGDQVDGAPRGRRHQLCESRVCHHVHAAPRLLPLIIQR
jgi:hypothetical protein